MNWYYDIIFLINILIFYIWKIYKGWREWNKEGWLSGVNFDGYNYLDIVK